MGLKKANQTSFKKGHIPWSKGRKGIHLSPDTEFKKGEMDGEKHPQWKGESASVITKHTWMYRKYGSPQHCEFCGKSGYGRRKYDWANRSGKYTRKRSDWIRLCRKCHRAYDARVHFSKRPRKKSSSGYRNVTWDKSRGKWLVMIGFNSKQMNIGRFDKIEDAIVARNRKRKEIYLIADKMRKEIEMRTKSF